jgi:hypothetical protein
MPEKEPMAEVRLELELGGIHASTLEPLPFAPAARERGDPGAVPHDGLPRCVAAAAFLPNGLLTPEHSSV